MERQFQGGDRVVWVADVYVEDPPGASSPAVVHPGDLGEVVDVDAEGLLGRLQGALYRLARRPAPVGLTVSFPETGAFGCLDSDVRHTREVT